MSLLLQFTACRGFLVSARNVKFNTSHLTRWQSSGTAPSRSGGGKFTKLIIGLAVGGGATVGGLLTYGNYDPAFKNQVNDIVPGFSSWTDKAADVWVDITDYFNPNPKKGKDELLFDHNEAKVKNELKKPPKKPESAKGDVKVDASLKDEGGKSAEGGKTPRNGVKGDQTPEKRVKGGQAPGKSVEGDQIPEKRVKGDQTPEKRVKGGQAPEKRVKDDQAPGKSTEVEKDTPKTRSDTTQTNHVQSQEEQVPKKGTSSIKGKEKPSKERPSKDPVTPRAESNQSSQPVPALQQPKGAKEPEGSATIKSEVVGVEQEPHLDGMKNTLSRLDAAQIGVLLEERYKTFMLSADRVKEAQKTLVSSWENLYLNLTSPDQRKDKISEAKAATSQAHGEFKVAADEYNSRFQQLKELVASAPERGFVAKATAIASDMSVKEAEVDLGLVLMKEAITNVKMVEGYREAIQESREKLKDDLEAAASLVDPERRDSILLSLNRKVEVLDHKLKESEVEHVQKLMLALEVQRRSLEQLAEEKLEHSLKESETKYRQLLVKEVNEVSSTYNGMMREQLRLENESHVEEMREALTDQADQLNSKWSSETELKLQRQQGYYQTELARARAKLGGLESMVDGVARAGEKTLQLQTLHNSCDTLFGVLDNAKLGDASDRLTVGTEVGSLRRAAGSDVFVASVLDSIPSQAVGGEGIQPEASLRERFVKVKRVCRRVALVPETGGGLGTYAISFVRSLLTVRTWLSDIPADVDPFELDVYDLLRLADVRLKKGDVEGAVYYITYLQGEPRNVAKDWLKDAILYLETRQAIQLIQTYMSANVAASNQ